MTKEDIKQIINKVIDKILSSQTQYLQLQTTEYKKSLLSYLSSIQNLFCDITSFPYEFNLDFDNRGYALIPQGSLIHCAKMGCYKKVVSIKNNGILSGDFIGIPEFNNGESFFCADFYRAEKNLSSKSFFERIEKDDGFYSRSPFGNTLKNSVNIAFLILPSHEKKANKLLNTNLYLKDSSKNILQSICPLIDKYKKEKVGMLSAIPFGVPVNLISGVILGDYVIQKKEYVNFINILFPNAYILDRNGKCLYSKKLSMEENSWNGIALLDEISARFHRTGYVTYNMDKEIEKIPKELKENFYIFNNEKEK